MTKATIKATTNFAFSSVMSKYEKTLHFSDEFNILLVIQNNHSKVIGMFITYWFVVFIGIFFPIYWFVNIPTFRKYWLLLACIIFHYRFAGPAGVLPILFLGVLTYLAGLSKNKLLQISVIIVCVLELIFYKYSLFFISQFLAFFNPDAVQTVLDYAKNRILPDAPPLAISFFVFEFVHYLVDVYRGKNPIRSVTDFSLFSTFWPSIVSGPIKRFEQFIPSIVTGCQKISFIDIQVGGMRIIIGLIKKLLIADNLTAWITYWQPHYAEMSLGNRYLFVVAISLRILFDFSGYSDMAIGFARMMGIKLPENFRWPYLATSIQDFWRRWHISLSSWIRDYIYIPLGGNRYGTVRQISNGVLAFALCGLWHGAAWNFMFWGLYHGVGLAISSSIQHLFSENTILKKAKIIIQAIGWLTTYLFVSIGWLYFFYPIEEATNMLTLLIRN